MPSFISYNQKGSDNSISNTQTRQQVRPERNLYIEKFVFNGSVSKEGNLYRIPVEVTVAMTGV